MHRIHKVMIGMRRGELCDGLADALKAATKAFAPVAGDQHHRALCAVRELCGKPVAQRCILVDARLDPQQCINDGVACDQDRVCGYAFSQQVIFGRFRGRKMQVGQHTRQFAIGLFGPGRLQVTGTQPGFDVANGHFLVEGGQGGGEGGGGVAMHQDHVRLFFAEHVAQAEQYTGGNVVEVLAWCHDVQVVVRHDIEQVQYLIQHFAVLGGDANAGVDTFCCVQGLDHRSHLDGFGAGAEDAHDFFGWSHLSHYSMEPRGICLGWCGGIRFALPTLRVIIFSGL